MSVKTMGGGTFFIMGGQNSKPALCAEFVSGHPMFSVDHPKLGWPTAKGWPRGGQGWPKSVHFCTSYKSNSSQINIIYVFKIKKRLQY